MNPSTLNHPLSIADLIAHATVLVQLIMLILFLFSVVSWFVIGWKTWQILQEQQRTESFLKLFSQTTDLEVLYRETKENTPQIGIEYLLVDGVDEYVRCRTLNKPWNVVESNVQRILQATAQIEIHRLERFNAILAAIASVSPYIGLLGTVWGIMHAFLGLSTAGSITLAQVAPGIAEALIATAIGLFAAIPAVLGHQFLTLKIQHVATLFDDFVDRLTNDLVRASL